MLMGQMLLSVIIAITAAIISVASGNGVLLTILVYSAAGSLSLLSCALLVVFGAAPVRDRR